MSPEDNSKRLDFIEERQLAAERRSDERFQQVLTEVAAQRREISDLREEMNHKMDEHAKMQRALVVQKKRKSSNDEDAAEEYEPVKAKGIDWKMVLAVAASVGVPLATAIIASGGH